MKLYRTFLEIGISAAGSGLWACLCYLVVWGDDPSVRNIHPLAWAEHGFRIPGWLIVSNYLLFASVLFGLIRARPLRAWRGRSAAMQQNLFILRTRLKIPCEEGTIYSTRISEWPIMEASEARAMFRVELDKAVVDEHRQVRRLWNVKNRDDARRLEDEVKRYEGSPNVSIAVFFQVAPGLLPEILLVNNRIGSLSFPQLRGPGGLEACHVITDCHSIGILAQYFEVLWNTASVALDGGRGVEATLRHIRELAARSED